MGLWVSEGGGSTSANKLDFEACALRSCSQNCVVISVGLLSDSFNERLFNCIHQVTKHVLHWDVEQRKLCRDSDGCESFVADQASGAFVRHLLNIIGTTSDPSALQACRCRPVLLGGSADDVAGEIIVEDDMADVLGQLASGMVRERLRRYLWLLRGYPWSVCRVLKDSSQFDTIIRQLKKDRDIFVKITGLAATGPVFKRLIRRHLFQKPSVQQLVDALQDPAYGSAEWKSDFRAMVRSHARVAVPSLAIEESIGVQKTVKVKKRGSKFGRPQKCFHKVITSGLFQKQHRWKVPKQDIPVGAKTEVLDESVFKAKTKHRSCNWNSVVTCNSIAPCYSAKAENFSQNVTDLPLLASVDEKNDFSLVERSYFAELSMVEHRLLVGVPLPIGGFSWFQALFYFPDSSAVLWPGRLEDIEGFKVFIPSRDDSVQPEVLPMYSMDGWVACTFRWKSFLWQLANMAASCVGQSPRMLQVVDMGPSPVMEVAARHAFWKLSRSQLVALMATSGLAIEADWNLCDLVFHSV